MSFDLTNKNISDTFHSVLQVTGSDGNELYDLVGNPVIDLRISGSLIAEQYVVSSSLVYITQSVYSGSTNFGDSADDNHRFTGSIRTTGIIRTSNGKIREDPTGTAGGTTGIEIGHSAVAIQLKSKDENSIGWTGVAVTQSRVGIGTATPSKTLTVAGDISASGDLYLKNTNYIHFASGSSPNYHKIRVENSGLTFYSGSTLTMVHADGGNVGIGTNIEPPKALTVEGDISASGNQWLEGNLALGSSTVSHSVNGLTVAGNISASGNLYVGQVRGDDLSLTGTTPNISLTETDASNALGTIGMWSGKMLIYNQYDNAAGDIEIRTMDFNDAIYIDNSAAKIGIGTSTPPKTLTVAGDISASGAISTYSHITASGNISGSSTSTGSVGTLNSTNVNTTNIYGTVKTTTQNSIREIGTLTTLTAGQLHCTGNKISGSLISTGSFANLILDFDNMPTSDPGVKGAVYRASGLGGTWTLRISAG